MKETRARKPPKRRSPSPSRPRDAESLRRSALLAQEARDILLVVGRDGRILEANRAATTAYGYPLAELLTLTTQDLRAPETRSLTAQQVAQADAAGILFETVHRRKDGSTFPVEVSSRGIKWGRQRVLLSLVRDITERVEAESALRQSEARFGAAFRASPDGIALTTLADGRLLEVNESALCLVGYTREEVIGRTVGDLGIWLHPENRDGLVQPLQVKGAVRDLEVELCPKAGEPLVVLVSAEILDIGGERCLLSVLHDITERKRIEDSLREREAALRTAHEELEERVEARTADLSQMVETLAAEVARRLHAEDALRRSREELRALAAHLESVREEERVAVAKEVHDILGQGLAGAKLNLAGLAAKLPPDQPVWQEKTEALTTLLDNLIRAACRIFEGLHPSVLDILGLVTALTEEGQAFQARTGIVCQVTAAVADRRLNPAQATALFRVCQECLSNVAQHAQATRVSIRLREEAERLVLEIADNGKGITDQEGASSTSFGLLSMRERMIFLGGDFTIVGQPSAGTTVTVKLPFPGA